MPIVVIGSGPAGVSAAWPLVAAGLDVVMLDASGAAAWPAAPGGTIGTFRRAPDRWRAQFGATLAGLVSGGDLSPKLETPLARAALGGYAESLRLETERFHAFGSLGRGGLSAIWGAMAPEFSGADFSGFPITEQDLAASYRAVGDRIGLGTVGLDGPALTLAPGLVLDRHVGGRGECVVIEQARNAVLAADRNGRRACAECGLCLWGCERRSIYSAAYELTDLLHYRNFDYRPGTTVRAIEGDAIVCDGGNIRARHVLLAAGTIATTALLARALGTVDVPIRLLTNPVAAVAFVIPGLIGTALPERSFGLAQLRHEIPLDGGEPAGGAIYGGDTLPLAEVARRIPLSRPTALRLSRALAPALLFATIYLPGRYSANTMTVGNDSVSIKGEITQRARDALGAARRRLARAMRALGAYAVPGSFTVSEAGADAHYAGTVPMGGAGPLACSADGEVVGRAGLHVVDGAALSALPSKHCTLTIMANADRIGRLLVTRS